MHWRETLLADAADSLRKAAQHKQGRTKVTEKRRLAAGASVAYSVRLFHCL